MTIVETCCCGARFETPTHLGMSDFRKAHADCRAAWVARQQAEAEAAKRTAFQPWDGLATCPKCRERKFIGHGPLCMECAMQKGPQS